MNLTLRAYNGSSKLSGSEQFLSMTRLHLKAIEKTMEDSRYNEQQMQIKNNKLSLEINQLKAERDALYKDLQLQESKVSPSSKSNKV